MPNASKRQRRANRRVKRSAARTEKVVGFTTTPVIFPSRKRGKMFYDTTFTLTCAANTVTSTVLRANSVFDPDFTGVGTTVAGYTQMAALYARYRVVGYRAMLSYQNFSSGPGFAFAVTNNLNTVGTNFAEICAQRYIWKAGLGSISGYGKLEKTVSAPINKIYGVPKQQVMIEDDFMALTSSSPNNQVFLHVGFSCAGTATTVLINVRMEYDVIWSLPLNMPY